MSTTTIRLPDELKARVASAAEAAGLTTHGFILRAIEAQTAAAEEQAEFERLAEKRWREFERTRTAIPLEDAARHLRDLAAGGKDVLRPQVRRIEPGLPVGRRAPPASRTRRSR